MSAPGPASATPSPQRLAFGLPADRRAACGSGLDERGEWPCEPRPNGDGSATCTVCGFTGRAPS